MSKIYFQQFSVDEVEFAIDFIEKEIAEYDLSGLTNNIVSNIPSVSGVHPLSVDMGDTDGDDFQSRFPAISVELVDDKENRGQQTLGRRHSFVVIDKEWIDNAKAVPLKVRSEHGLILSDTTLQKIETEYNTKAGEGGFLYAKRHSFLQDQTLNVSIWSSHYKVTRTVYLVMRSIMKRLEFEFAERGVMNSKVNGQLGLYNFDFNETLHGGEFMMEFHQRHEDFEVDGSIGQITGVDMQVNAGVSDISKLSGPVFTVIGKEPEDV